MKLTVLLLCTAFLNLSARAISQITISETNAPLKKVFRQIEKQTGYLFWYNNSLLEKAAPVSIQLKNASLQAVLDLCLKDQVLTYSIVDKVIVIKATAPKEKPDPPSPIDISGRVTNEKGEPIIGATVTEQKSKKATATDLEGNFNLSGVDEQGVLLITSIGYEPMEWKIDGKKQIALSLRVAVNTLDETVVIAYGTTTKRLNTGSVSKVTSEEIGKQPVSNPLAALQGRVPGLVVTQTSGYGSGAFDIKIRGQGSIIQGSQPFFIIDGVPLAPQNTSISQISSAANGFSPLYTVNPSDIESIEVLKDADATAIYGSRGANGVILITTKKGKSGKTKVSLNTYSGFSKVTRSLDMMSTADYIKMRKEAYRNDGIIPTGANATDILVWDTTRYTDLKKFFLDGTAYSNDVNLSLSGGNSNTQILISGNYHRETTVLPTNLADYRMAGHASVSHTSSNKNLAIQLISDYSYTRNSLPALDPSSFITRPPNIQLYDQAGNINWEEKGVSFAAAGIGEYNNPLSALKTQYTGNFQNMKDALLVNYKIYTDLAFVANLGYNIISSSETRTYPSASRDPFDNNQTPQSYFSLSNSKTWIVEPQLQFKKKVGFGKIDFLLGSTWQKKTGTGINVTGLNYTSDLLLSSISGAGSVFTATSFDDYRYDAIFGRFNYNWREKYIVNLTGRRDGSSRFGPGKRFSNFGAIGTAWILSDENFFRKLARVLSFAKFRGSYGIAGNDLIGDYQYLDTWVSTGGNYQGSPSFAPRALFNPDLAWELNKKLEGSLDIGILNQRIELTFSFFRNRSANQLVSYNLPIQTGFASIPMNLDALVQNKGYEFTLTTKNISSKKIRWSSDFNLTISRNKLLQFPGLALSSYSSRYVIGEPISTLRLYKYLGVNPLTGTYTYLDVDNNGTLNITDRIANKNTQAKYYGGLRNTIALGGLEIDFFFQFVKQPGVNYLSSIGANAPGFRFRNQPAFFLERWQKPGDESSIHKFTTLTNVDMESILTSDAIYGDASFIRCKNVSISYNFPSHKLQGSNIESLQIYLHTQNLFTITDYIGADPETQNVIKMPPMRTLTAGLLLNF